MKSRTSWAAVIGMALIAGALTAGVNHAQTATAMPGLRVGVVDLVRVFNEFEQTKALNAELDRYKQQLAQEQQQREETLAVERNTLQSFAPDSAEYFTRAKAFKKMMIEYQAWLAVERETLKDEHRRWVERTYQTTTDMIAQIAQVQGIQLVLTREELDTQVDDTTVLQKQILGRKVVYFDPILDMTDTVLRNLNDAFNKAGGAQSIRLGS